jgi:hypothetical protein
MTTGWKWIASDGQTFTNQLAARQALLEDPRLTMVFSEISMAGVKVTDVSEKLRSSVQGVRSEPPKDEWTDA